MKHVKQGAECRVIKPVLLDALLRLTLLYHQYEQVLVVTEISGGTHKTGSLHYKGYAADLRTRDFPAWQLPHVLDAIQLELGHDWDIIQETDHFHIEYDPDHDGGKRLP